MSPAESRDEAVLFHGREDVIIESQNLRLV